MAVPYTFGNATSSIPLSQLDNNFATAITIGNTAVQLGNTITTVNNLTLANVTISSVATAVTPVEGGTGLTSVGITGNVLTSNGTAWVSQAPAASASSISNGTSNVSISSSNGNITAYTNGALAMTIDTNQNTIHVGTSVMGSSFLRNRIINGNMAIWQRGTTGFTTSGGYGADRWYVACGGTISAGQQSTDVPTGYQYSYLFTSTGFPALIQRIEAKNCTDLSGASITISFWAKQTSGAGSNTVFVQLYYATASDNFASTTQIGSTQTFTGTTGWVQYSTTFTGLPSGVLNGIQLNIGSNLSGSSTTLVTGVQLEVGTVATPFERPLYSKQLADCQRYFYSIAQPPFRGVVTGANGGGRCGYMHPVPMRAIPTLTASGAFPCYDGSATSTATINNNYSTVNVCETDFTNASGLTAYRPFIIYQTGSSYLQVSAEL